MTEKEYVALKAEISMLRRLIGWCVDQLNSSWPSFDRSYVVPWDELERSDEGVHCQRIADSLEGRQAPEDTGVVLK